MRLDWLIVGGGPQGVHLATRLLGEANVDPERLRIVDPAPRLLARWDACTATTGMKHLRSAAVHHLDLSPWSLRRFAGHRKSRPTGLFAVPYDRPALDLFNRHCRHVIETHGLDDLHVRARATACKLGCDGVRVELDDGQALRTSRLLLAIGASDQPQWPEWAPRDHACVHHIFEPGFDAWPNSPERVAVLGAGISAGQIALRLASEGHAVHMISRHALREHQFDSDSGWLGPKNMARFDRVRDPQRRRAIITKARHRGSVSPDIARGLRRAIAKEQVRWHLGSVERFDPQSPTLHLSTEEVVEIDRVLLATGFCSRRPGGQMLDALIASASLPCAECGYPIVDHALRWHPRIHVCGPLAELELGPISRNIAGARRAGDRVVRAALRPRAR